jgi:hypothetical protein
MPYEKFKLKVRLTGQANRLVGREQFVHRIPVTHATLEGKSQHSCRLCAEKSKLQTGKTVKKWTTTYCRKCDVGLCIGQCFEVYHSKLRLLGVNVTIEFHRQCHKNLVCAQCVNLSGRVVTVNVVILTSKFPIVLSGSKYT